MRALLLAAMVLAQAGCFGSEPVGGCEPITFGPNVQMCRWDLVGFSCAAVEPCTDCVCMEGFVHCPSVALTCERYGYCRHSCNDDIPACLAACDESAHVGGLSLTP